MPRTRLLSPGPVAVPERVLRAMGQPLIHHRSADFAPLFGEVRENLRAVFQTTRDVLVLASSGTGGMEAVVANLVTPGDRVLVVRAGKFGERWGELCMAYGAHPEFVDAEWGEPVDPGLVRDALRRQSDVRAVFAQASETSTGVQHPIAELAALVREREGVLFAVDAISALGVHDLPMDAWGVDAVVGASQKSFMLPPGLAFVALSARAEAALERGAGPRFYFDLRRELRAQRSGSTGFTPALSLLVGLRESLRVILEEGLPRAFARYRATAEAARAAVRALDLELLARRSWSNAATAVRVPAGIDGKLLVRRLREDHGIILAGGQGRLEGKIFRIGHIGWIDGLDLLAAIGALEVVLGELGCAVKPGQGIRVIAERLAELCRTGA
jgi:aspartate aminotransferase-like enzyme